MTRVGWLADKHDPPGGAELTQTEFRAAAPDGVEVVDCPPGEVDLHCDRYVFHNVTTYKWIDFLNAGGRRFKYHHDTRVALDPWMRKELTDVTCPVYCSPLQRKAMGVDGDYAPMVPPALDLDAFRSTGEAQRKGTCCVGAFMNPGKGGHLVSEWADANEPVDVYGWGSFLPVGPSIRNCGALEHSQLPAILQRYERFVFLPTALEPFGRCVVEAWASGCELIVNGNVGARYWIEEAPEKLESAAEDFWRLVLGSSPEVTPDFASPKARGGPNDEQDGDPVGHEVQSVEDKRSVSL